MSAAPPRRRATQAELYPVESLLWHVRHDPGLADQLRAGPAAVLDRFGVVGADREALAALDLRALYDRGANPYLLYFCALQLGISRQDYYRRLGEVGT